MHMRLEIAEDSRSLQRMEALRLLNGVRRNIQSSADIRSRLETGQIGPILRRFVFGIKPHSQFDVIANRLADGMIVNVPPDLRARQQQLAGVGTVNVASLS